MAARRSLSPLVRSSNLQFFMARAMQAKADGDASTLDQVRERFRRSETAWRAMAERVSHAEQLRAERTGATAAVPGRGAPRSQSEPSENPDRGLAD